MQRESPGKNNFFHATIIPQSHTSKMATLEHALTFSKEEKCFGTSPATSRCRLVQTRSNKKVIACQSCVEVNSDWLR